MTQPSFAFPPERVELGESTELPRVAVARLRREGYRFHVIDGQIFVDFAGGGGVVEIGHTGLPGSLFGGHVAQAIRLAERDARRRRPAQDRDARLRAELGEES